jgi:hypothetical protein
VCEARAEGQGCEVKRKIAGVYMLMNRATGERYVGCSANLHTRLRSHFFGIKSSHASKKIRTSALACPPGTFVYQLLEITAPGFVPLEREAYWIDRIKPELNDHPGRRSFDGALNKLYVVKMNQPLMDALKLFKPVSPGRAFRAIVVGEMLKEGRLKNEDVPARVFDDIRKVNEISLTICAERGRK